MAGMDSLWTAPETERQEVMGVNLKIQGPPPPQEVDECL